MAGLDNILSFIATCFIIELTPGPNMAYLAILSVSDGRRAALSAVAGVACGLLFIGMLGALGVSALIDGSPAAYRILKWSGVVYLAWLAWDGWHSDGETSPGRAHGGLPPLKFFLRGFITNCLNPKALLFYVAILPGFVDPDASVVGQTVTLTVAYVLLATAIHGSIVILAGSVRGFLTDPARNRTARRILSALLALVAFWLAWGEGRD